MSQFKNDGSFLQQFLAGKGVEPQTASAYAAAAAPAAGYAQPPYGGQPMGGYENPYGGMPPMGYDAQQAAAYGGGYGNAAPYGQPAMVPTGSGGFAPAFVGAGGYAPPPPSAAASEPPSECLFLGNVPESASESDIRREFARFGMIERVKILNHKNCAFVNFSELESAVNALNAMQGLQIHGQTIRVGFGRADQNRSRHSDRDEVPPCTNLWIGNLSERVNEDDLYHHFSFLILDEAFGRLERVKVLNHKNCGFVTYVELDDAIRARSALTGIMIHDRAIKINFSRDDYRRDRRDDHHHHDDRPSHMSSAPPFGYPPADEQLKKHIVKTSDMIVRRNLDAEKFSAFVALKDHDDAGSKSLGFLLGGTGGEYFRWRTYCAFNNLPDDQYVPRSDHRARKVHYNGTLTGEDRKELSDLLQALTGTKESIKNATNWISQHCYYASDVVSTMDIEINSNISYEKKLFIFYVVNDTLGYCSRYRSDPTVLDPLCQAFANKMVSILRAVYTDDPENQSRVMKVLQLWGVNGYYEESTIRRWEELTKSDEPIPDETPEEEELPPWLQDGGFSPPPGGDHY